MKKLVLLVALCFINFKCVVGQVGNNRLNIVGGGNSNSNSGNVTGTMVYCTPTGTNTSGCNNTYITNVTFNTINNNSVLGPSGYSSYPASGLTTTSVIPGSTYSISISVNSISNSPGVTTVAGVWIDFNQNQNFAEASEFFTVPLSGTTQSGSANIAIPSGALTGQATMRVRMAHGTTATATMSCLMDGSYGSCGGGGEAEDYIITIGAPVAHCSNGIKDADEVRVDCGGADCPTCAPYCSAAGSIGNAGYLTNVTLNTINRTSAFDGYINSGLSTNAVRGQSYSLDIAFQVTTYLAQTYAQTQAWIDFNSNGVFSDPGEIVLVNLVTTTAGSHIRSASFTVPVTAPLGITKMRVMQKQGTINADGCQSTSMYGDVEDYDINIVCDNPTMTNVSSASICSGATVSIPLTSSSSSTYSWLAIDNPNVTGEQLNSQSGALLSNTLVNLNTIPELVNYLVTPTSTITGCIGTIQTVTVTVNPLPVIDFTGLNSVYCLNSSSSTLIGSPTGGTFSGVGVSGNTFNPTVALSGTHIVSYTYTDVNVCTNTITHTTQVSPTPITPEICMVTVDDPGNNNIVYWDKTNYGMTDTFFVYREITNGNFQIIGKVPYDSLSMFVDTVRTLYFPNTGDPRSFSYKYTIAIKDTCGNLSAMSLYHGTMFLQDQLNGNFNWTHYEIEGQTAPVSQLTSYAFLRDNDLDLVYETTIGTTTNNLATDPQYLTYQLTADWRIETNWSIVCEPTFRLANGTNDIQTQIVRSKSNIRNQRSTGIKDGKTQETRLKVYPNPANDLLNVEVSLINATTATITIENMLGQVVYTTQTNKRINSINTSLLETGVYFVKVNTGKGLVVEKVIIN